MVAFYFLLLGDRMITLDQLKAAYSDAGISVNDSTAQCIVDIVNTAEPCLIGKGLDNCTITLAQQLAGMFIGSNMSANKVVTGKSIKGISINYKVESASVTQQSWYNTLAAFGVLDCFSQIVPDPTDRPQGFIFAGVGCR